MANFVAYLFCLLFLYIGFWALSLLGLGTTVCLWPLIIALSTQKYEPGTKNNFHFTDI